MKKFILIALAILVLAPAAYAASQSIWGSTDRGPVVSTYRIPVDTSISSTPGYISIAEIITYLGTHSVLTLTTTGTSGAATYSAGTLNIPQYANSTFQQSMASQTQLSLGGL